MAGLLVAQGLECTAEGQEGQEGRDDGDGGG